MEAPGHGKLYVVDVGPDFLLDLKHGQKQQPDRRRGLVMKFAGEGQVLVTLG
jgi:hypothetical protein